VKAIAALTLLVAGAAFLPRADAQTVSVRIDTPEIGIRIGAPVDYGPAAYPVPVYPAPVYAPPPVIVAPRPVAVYPAPVYLPPPPPRVIVPPPRVIVAPAPVYYYGPPHLRPYPYWEQGGRGKHKHRDRYERYDRY
jgi:hypothetical protein